MNIKKWCYRKLDKNKAVEIANENSIPFFLAMMLEIRGIREHDQIREFLSEKPAFSDPFLLPDMDKAVERIRRAIDGFERIAIFGDYDADGVTATAILYSYLEANGANVTYHIPDREREGYGMSKEAVRELAQLGCDLIITVDNGISSVEEAALAKELSIDLVITDHHRPQEKLPEAAAVVDPLLSDRCYPYFSGAGIALKLVMAMEGEENYDDIIENYLDLAAIGTIGDVVPLTGENRTIAKLGIARIEKGERAGVYALMREASVAERKLNTSLVAFTIVPRINAAGRIASANEAEKLLLCEDPDEAIELARDLCAVNTIRKDIESEIYEKACAQLAARPEFFYDSVLVLSGEGWHPGVLGIVASRITERFGKPSIIISISESGYAKGSGRSIEGFSLFDALASCSEVLTQFGGHTMAAGLSLSKEQIEPFRKRINEYAASVAPPQPQLLIDCRLKPSALSAEIPKLLSYLEPCGTDNPAPLFALCGMKLESITPIGSGKHLRLRLEKGGAAVNCVKFGVSPEEFPYLPGDELDLAVTLETQIFRGTESLSVFVREIQFANEEKETEAKELRVYEKFRRGAALSSEEQALLLPDRAYFAALYRYLKNAKSLPKDLRMLYHRAALSGFGKFLTALRVFEEAELIEIGQQLESFTITVREVSEKKDLFATQTMKSLQAN